MVHFSLITHHNMGINCDEDRFNMGTFFLPKASFIMGKFSDPQHTHPGISYWSRPTVVGPSSPIAEYCFRNKTVIDTPSIIRIDCRLNVRSLNALYNLLQSDHHFNVLAHRSVYNRREVCLWESRDCKLYAN